MPEHLRNALIMLRSQLWILPVGMSTAAVVLAFAMLGWTGVRGSASQMTWIFNGDAETARNLLSALLSGLMTMTSLVVSITFVILTLASNQLGPRLVTNFIADRQIQIVLGLFLGTSLYILVVLRSLDGSLGPDEIPHVAVTTSTVLTASCLIALLFYIHKVARSIVADTMAQQVYARLEKAIGELPERGNEKEAVDALWYAPRHCALGLGRIGYIQTIDYPTLVRLAAKHDLQLEVKVRAGHFVLRQGEHVIVHSNPGELPDGLTEKIRSAFVLGSERSPAQDLEYSVRQLVEVALRALSPGINDPFTVVAIIDRLGASIEQILSRALRPAIYTDEAGGFRVVADRSGIEGLIDASFAQIRQAGAEQPSILIHLADTFARLGHGSLDEEARTALTAHLRAIEETVVTLIESDRTAVLQRTAAAHAVLREKA